MFCSKANSQTLFFFFFLGCIKIRERKSECLRNNGWDWGNAALRHETTSSDEIALQQRKTLKCYLDAEKILVSQILIMLLFYFFFFNVAIAAVLFPDKKMKVGVETWCLLKLSVAEPDNGSSRFSRAY